MPNNHVPKPDYDEYLDWYKTRFLIDLDDGSAQNWYDDDTLNGVQQLEGSRFWIALRRRIEHWDESYKAIHDRYPLFWDTSALPTIARKSFESVLEKSFRRNVLYNKDWPRPPIRNQKNNAESRSDEREEDDPQWWYGPNNWLTTFPDIFRTRLTATYFDGVRYLAKRIDELSKQITSNPPKPKFHASNDGYHAAHLGVRDQLKLRDYENLDPVLVSAHLEIQVTTTIQATINRILHRVYEEWRLYGRPKNWQWEHDKTAFSANYLGSTLHYLEGMIVTVRDQKEIN